ncbi:hypothetical protein [Piscirickettsia salmonis]|nr:hypothetical protein [Piscirickettsia salmonis]
MTEGRESYDFPFPLWVFCKICLMLCYDAAARQWRREQHAANDI